MLWKVYFCLVPGPMVLIGAFIAKLGVFLAGEGWQYIAVTENAVDPINDILL